jgi:hypothetical protein
MIDPVIAMFFGLSGALLFAAAALHKLRDPSIFVATLAEYRLVPHAVLWPVAVVIIAAEVVVTVGLAWPAVRQASAVAAMVLLLIYAIAMAINLGRGRRDLDCGCALQRRPVGPWMVVRNVFIAAALGSLLLPEATRPLVLTDLLTLGASLLLASLIYVSADLLLSSRPSDRASPAAEFS